MHEMAAGRAELVGHRLAEDVGLDGRGFGLQRAALEPRVGLAVRAEGDDARNAGGLGGVGELRELPDVAIDDGRAARLEPEKDFGLGLGDLLQRAEEFEMHRRDGGDDRHMRAHHLRERRDLAGMVHADFEHRVFRSFRQPRERERHAPVIVVGGGRGMRLAVGGERELQGLLGGGLADRAGDRDDLGLRARARGAAEIAQGLQHVLDDQQRRVG